LLSAKKHGAALTLVGLALTGSLLLTSAFAAPPKSKKPPKKAVKGSAAQIAAGKKVYAANGCANCHTIAGKGGKIGPELTRVGAEANHTPKWLEEKVANPKASNPDSTMPAFGDKIKGKDLTALGAYLASLKK
jgi:mono/diheme cytochrome c family protein